MCCANFCPIGVHAAPAKPIVAAHGKSVKVVVIDYSTFKEKSRVSACNTFVREQRREKEREREREQKEQKHTR